MHQNTIEQMKRLTLPIVIEKDDDGFFVKCPILQGCYSQGDTYEEAIKNIKEAIELCLEDMESSGETLPVADSFSLLTVEVTI